MLLNSFIFICLLPLALCLYWIVTRSVGKQSSLYSTVLLVGFSYAFYIYNAPLYSFILIGITAVTYIFGRLFENVNMRRRRLVAFAITILVLIPLFLFKYSNFVLETWSDFLGLFGVNYVPVEIPWILPLGTSFFTFQALGYMWDVYHGQVNAERNFLVYMLFVAFFPQLASGPISKSSELMPQIKRPKVPRWLDLSTGFKILLWGYFLKVVLADRFALFSTEVFKNYEMYSGLTCFMGSISYSLRIYGDFAGYSLMAVGIARMFGFDIINNFRRPYLAATLNDFWRRWHISLTRWFREHIYFPMGGNRCGKLRTYFNIIVVFTVSGIWHGANMTFIIWGLIHGVVQCIERFFGLTKTPKHKGIRVLRIVGTFLIVNFAFIIFAMPDVGSAMAVISKIFNMTPGLGLNPKNVDLFFAILALLIVVVKEFCEEYRPNVTLINHRTVAVRFASVIVLIFLIVGCGILDSSNFIYVNF